MSTIIHEVEGEMTFNHLPKRNRFFMFLNRAKFKLIFAAGLAVSFNYWANLLGVLTSRAERSCKKYKKRYIMRKNPVAMTYASANDALFETKYISG